MMGRHSVMLRPDSVRRVTPPTTMTAKTRVEDKRSQRATGGAERMGSSSATGAPLDEKKRGVRTVESCCSKVTGLGFEKSAYERVRRKRAGVGACLEDRAADRRGYFGRWERMRLPGVA